MDGVLVARVGVLGENGLLWCCFLFRQPHDLPEGDWFCDACKRERCGLCKSGKLYMNKHVICGSDNKRARQGCGRVFHLVRNSDVVVWSDLIASWLL